MPVMRKPVALFVKLSGFDFKLEVAVYLGLYCLTVLNSLPVKDMGASGMGSQTYVSNNGLSEAACL